MVGILRHGVAKRKLSLRIRDVQYQGYELVFNRYERVQTDSKRRIVRTIFQLFYRMLRIRCSESGFSTMAELMRPGRFFKGVWLGALALLASGAMAAASADPTDAKPPKPSSFAPHPTAKRAFGTPVSKPILHKRKKHKPPAAPAPAEPIK